MSLSHTLSGSSRQKTVYRSLEVWSMTNAKVVGPDLLPVELRKLGLNHDPTALCDLFSWRGASSKYRSSGEMP